MRNRIRASSFRAFDPGRSAYTERPDPFRRGGREVECTALEMRHTREGIVGSNPTLSAMTSKKSIKTKVYTAAMALMRLGLDTRRSIIFRLCRVDAPARRLTP